MHVTGIMDGIKMTVTRSIQMKKIETFDSIRWPLKRLEKSGQKLYQNEENQSYAAFVARKIMMAFLCELQYNAVPMMRMN